MGRALFTGVTGLRVHQTRLDVVANNIANTNTVGFRGGRVLFQDLFSQTLRGGSAPVGTFGGTNPQQVGLGVSVASIDVDHSQGSLITTGNSADLAIQGNGFFILTDGVKTGYTRDGSFQLNANGTLIDPATGFRIQGFVADDQGFIDTNEAPTDISIPLGGTGIVRSTSTALLIGNLSADAPPDPDPLGTVTRTIEVFDSLGVSRNVTLSFVKQGGAPDPNTWNWTATFNGAGVGSGVLTFNPDGTLPNDTTGAISIPAADLMTNGSTPEQLDFTLDFSEVTQLSTGDELISDITLSNQDGFPRGILESFNIGGNGEVVGVFDNGLSRVIAQVALASFSNVGGLSRDGNNLFLETPSSGVAQIGPPQSGARGEVVGGVLENSNVDLGAQFSDLIITQRGFQANARTITAADTLLQETVNLIR